MPATDSTARRLSRLARCAAAVLAASLVIVAPALAVPSGGSAAAQVEAKRAEAARVRAVLDKQRQKLAAGIAQAEKVSADLEQTRRAVASEAARLGNLQRRLALRQRQLNLFAVHSYRYGEADTLATLLGAASFEDLLTRARYVAIVGAQQAETVAWVRRARGQSSRLVASLKRRGAQLAATKAQADATRASIQAEMAAQQRSLDSLSADVNRLLAQQEKARAATSVGRPAPDYNGPSGGSDWMSAASLAPGARATIEGHAGTYVVPAGVPGTYRSTGVEWQAEASQYSVADNGTGTSSGRPLDDGELTCAHKTVPLGTLIAVTHGGNRVIVVVTDRGPFSPAGRDIDLSLAAAGELGIDGIGQVHEEIVTPVR